MQSRKLFKGYRQKKCRAQRHRNARIICAVSPIQRNAGWVYSLIKKHSCEVVEGIISVSVCRQAAR